MALETLGSFIAELREDLLAVWMQKVRATLPSGAGLSETDILDSMKHFLDEIVANIEGEERALLHHQDSEIARAHGSQRQELKRNIADLVREYHLFYETVLEVARRNGIRLADAQLDLLLRCLFSGAASAVEQFAAQEQAERQRIDYQNFAFVAHELRNPLFSTKLTWEVLQRKHPNLGREAELMTRGLQQLSELIDRSLEHSRNRIVAAGADLAREPVDVAALLAEAEEDATSAAESKEVHIVVETEGHVVVDGDHRLLRSALTNLTRNAIKFSRRGGSVRLRSHVEVDKVAIDVEDACGGLPSERREHLFRAFVQAGGDRSGFGLGLAIAKQAAEAHGGSIRVTDVPGHGCVFTLELPTRPDGA